MKKGFLIFDVESSGLYNPNYVAYNKNQAWIVQIAGIRTNSKLRVLDTFSYIMKPPFKGASIEQGAFEAHGITLQRCISKGIPQYKLHSVLKPVWDGKVLLVGHNLNFDVKFLHRFPKNEKERRNLIEAHHNGICTMKSSIYHCKLPATKAMHEARLKGQKKWKNWKPCPYKSPTLTELHSKLFGKEFTGAHDAMNDVNATFKSFKKLIKLGAIKI
jgi:DNA polymerase III epsilon subunit-like protein